MHAFLDRIGSIPGVVGAFLMTGGRLEGRTLPSFYGPHALDAVCDAVASLVSEIDRIGMDSETLTVRYEQHSLFVVRINSNQRVVLLALPDLEQSLATSVEGTVLFAFHGAGSEQAGMEESPMTIMTLEEDSDAEGGDFFDSEPPAVSASQQSERRQAHSGGDPGLARGEGPRGRTGGTF